MSGPWDDGPPPRGAFSHFIAGGFFALALIYALAGYVLSPLFFLTTSILFVAFGNRRNRR